MTTLALPEIPIVGRLVFFISGLAWLILSSALAVSNMRSYRRRVTVEARCVLVTRISRGKFSYLLRRKPVAGESRNVSLDDGKGPRLRLNEELEITYDPKNAHLIYAGKIYPRFTHGRAIVLFLVIGLGFLAPAILM
ncbi:hypothetical protein ACFV98_25175 [Streptomyces violascens]|uniref:hypothetical protein n=1 Tax=Streptomyces violascens TaxID=67381 RepID=UPI00364AE4B5